MKQRNFLQTFLTPVQWLRGHKFGLFLIPSGAAAIAVVMLSCATLHRTVLEPPRIPGASYIGSEACADCHEEIVRGFKAADHARLKAEGDNAKNVGCESCHGPGSVHKESGGAKGTIINPRKSPDTCFQCHLEVKARFQLPNHHPVMEGRMSCVDCHNPHKGKAIIGNRISLNPQDDTCGKCHVAQRGPFVFEHEALREGCTLCHQVHGSVNARMLVDRNQTLCLRCHFQQQTVTGQLLIGNVNHASFLPRGTCWSAGCHEEVHGSQVSPHLRY